MIKSKVLFTDGEGPIVYKDLAFDLMKRITFYLGRKEILGRSFFEAISFYDDYCAEIGMQGYQAGDTLALIVPHLIVHKINDSDVLEESKTASVIKGVEAYIKDLQKDYWDIRIISTAYRPMWNFIGGHLGIPQEHIACTELDLNSLTKQWASQNFRNAVENFEQQVLSMLSSVEQAISKVEKGVSVTQVLADGGEYEKWRTTMDQFYWQTLPELEYKPLEIVSVVGGRRKIEHADRFARELNVSLKDVAYVGDSITDSALFKHLKKEGGLPIAVNGNRYALRDALVAVATTDMTGLRVVLDRWSEGGLRGVENFIEENTVLNRRGKELEGSPESENFPHYALVSKKNLDELVAIHKVTRKAVRGEAAAIG